MQSIFIYLYDQILKLQLTQDYELRVEDPIVYTQPLNIYKGINNPIKIQVRNSDQKPLNITGLTFYAEILRNPERDFVGSVTATVVDAVKGIANIVIPAATLNPLAPGYYTLMVKCWNGTAYQIGYVDDNYSVEIPMLLTTGYRVPGDVYELGEHLDLGSLPELVDEIRDLGAF